MSLMPIDKSVDDLLSRKAREMGKSKAEILRMIIDRGNLPTGEAGEQWISPQDMVKALNTIPDAKPGSLAEQMKEMAGTMMTMKMVQMLNSPQQVPVAAQHDPMGDMTRIFMLKELTKPSMYEIMMMEKLNRGEEPSPMLKQLADGEKETRELLKQMLSDKKEAERQGEIDRVVGAMTESVEAMKENYNKILDYVAKGEHAGKDTIEGYIANALKEELTDRALDAIDRGFFKKEQIVTEEGGFNWKGILDRMMNIGEEFVKKMPTRTPPPSLLRRMDGNYVNPATGQVLTPEQAAQVMQTGPSAASPTVAQPAPPPDQATQQPMEQQSAQPSPEASAEEHKSFLKKKAAELSRTFEQQDGVESGSEEPTGQEQY